MTTKFKQQGKIQTGKTEPSIPKKICPACNDEYLKNLYERVCEGKKRSWIHRAYRCPKCGKITKKEKEVE
jgi:uncharacterized protein with PIN domain